MYEILTQMWSTAVKVRTDATREALAQALAAALWGR